MERVDANAGFRTRRGQLIFLLPLFLLVATIPSSAWAWATEDHEDIASDAIRLSPPEIRNFLAPLAEWVKDGASAPSRVFRDCENHGFSPLVPKGRGRGYGPQWSAVPRAIEVYRDVVEGLKSQEQVGESVIARRMGILAHYVSSIVQPPRTSWKCDSESRYPKPIFLGWDGRGIPTDIGAELVAAGKWASEIDPRKLGLDSLYYATSVSLTARIWAAVWKASGQEVSLDGVTDLVLFSAGREVLLRAPSLVEYCREQYEKASALRFALVLSYPLYSTQAQIALVEVRESFWKKKLDEAMLWEAEKKTPSAEELHRKVADLEKGHKEGLELLEYSIIRRDATLIINGRFINHGPTPVSDMTLAIQLFDAKGAFLKQLVEERALASEDPEGFLPKAIYRFRREVKSKELPEFAAAQIVLIRSSSKPEERGGRLRMF